jgi:AraC-like DNA-binding protein
VTCTPGIFAASAAAAGSSRSSAASRVTRWHSHPVSAVARRAGYDTASAFVAAFRRETGLTPAAYFRDPS